MKNRILELRKKNNYTLAVVAKAIGVGTNTISRYETDKREPKIETWQALADFFEVSVPYLQGELSYSDLTPEEQKLEDRLSRTINNDIDDEIKYSELSSKENKRAIKLALQSALEYYA